MSPGTRGLAAWQALFGQVSHAASGRKHRTLDRNSLPSPTAYLTEQGLLTGRPRAEWVSVRCPVHKSGDETHPSMRVSLADGHFCCHACGAKGGDVIALHRLITGMGFRDAVADVGGSFHD